MMAGMAAKKSAAKESAKKAPPAKGALAKKAKKAAAPAMKKFGQRADLGAPVAGFFARQPPHLLPIVEALRAMIEEAAPEATSAIKWGMPFYTVGPGMMCAIGAHKSHVNLILPGPPGTYADPRSILVGDGKTGRHLKLMTLDALPRTAVRGWLRIAAERARDGVSTR